MKKPTPAVTNAPENIAPEDQPTSGMDNSASADTLHTTPPPEALPTGGGRYTRTPAGDLVRVTDQPTQPASDGHDKKEQP